MSYEIMGITSSKLKQLLRDKVALDTYRKFYKKIANGKEAVHIIAEGKEKIYDLKSLIQLDLEDVALQEYRKGQKAGLNPKSIKVKSSIPENSEEKEFSRAQLVRLDKNDKALQKYQKLNKDDNLKDKIQVADVVAGKFESKIGISISVKDALLHNKKQMDKR